MSSAPNRMFVTADTVALRCSAEDRLEVLLVERGSEPYQGSWALPGGFVEQEEDLPVAAARELQEETGLEPRVLFQVGAWGEPGRDPRGRNVTVAHVGVMPPDCPEPEGLDDAAGAAWHPAEAPPELAFDHRDILNSSLRRMRDYAERTHLAFAYLEEPFSFRDLAGVLEALGAGHPQNQGSRLIAAARVDSQPAEAEKWSLAVDDYHARLGEPVLMFPVERDGGQ